MSRHTAQFYEFGDFCLDLREKQLSRHGLIIQLTPKAYEVLLFLVENSGHLVSKEQFLEKVWAGSFVEENNLADNISILRKVLGDDPRAPIFIETVPRRGYRLIAKVTSDQEPHETRPTFVPSHTPFTRRWVLIAAVVCIAGVALALLAYAREKRTASNIESHPPIRSIAVLPFKPIVTTSEDEYLEFGLADALITRLSNVNGISVRPTSTMLQYRGRAVAPGEVGREQKVDSVLSGQFQKLNDEIRLTVQLVTVNDGAVVWAQTFDDRLTNIFSVQDSISAEVARALRFQLSGEERQRIAKRSTQSAKAYEYYLRGSYSFSKWTREGVNKAIEYYQLAIDTDSSYAEPYAGLSKCYHVLGTHYQQPLEVFPKAREYAQKAVELDSTLGDAWASLGLAKMNQWNWSGAEKDLRRSFEVNPNYAEGREIYAHVLMVIGRMDQAIAEMKQARAIDPMSPSIVGGLANLLAWARRYDEAIEVYKNMLELYPNRPDFHIGLAMTYARASRKAEALAAINKAVSLSENKDDLSINLALVYALTDKSSEARKSVNQLEQRSKREYLPALGFAQVYAALGEIDESFAWLERAYREHTASLSIIKFYPEFDSLRDDPRYADLRRRIGL